MFPKALKTVFEGTKANAVIAGNFEESLVVRAAVLRRDKAAVSSLVQAVSPLDPCSEH